MKCLIVDDEEILVDILESLLLGMGDQLEVLKAYDGDEALEIYKKNKHSIGFILTDIKMKRMNGLDFLTQVNILESPPISCIMSGHLPDLSKFNFDNKLFAIMKPFGKDDLSKLIKEAS
jgi:two-component SAPR family response regulator